MEAFPNLSIEEGDLSFVIRFEVEEAVTAYSSTCDAFDRIDFTDGERVWVFPVVAEEVVSFRDVDAHDLHDFGGLRDDGLGV